ncbi:GNAT family N-acetyltransferase [Halovulum dunhuangense]|uniref:GNAT family N-acetyltransferase n=2 Tax=Halovulum dunhuangense TaxID=1505036 RepID=A0A849L2Q3_9RHOB|nr:GNAT family N-acetyltransferase [Halovulum dunhuangense]NNU80543.1 GNAT family N-acetyltransferase [Halovulum dunhuangense]
MTGNGAAAQAGDQPVLVTGRLRLRPIEPADAGLMRLYAQDARVARMTRNIPHPLPPGATESYIGAVLSGAARETVWAVEHRASDGGGFIGVVSLGRKGRIGYWLGAPFWSTGFATEAVEALVSHALEQGYPRLEAEVFQDNPASARVLTKAGFAYVGEGEGFSIARGATAPVWHYALEAGQ